MRLQRFFTTLAIAAFASLVTTAALGGGGMTADLLLLSMFMLLINYMPPLIVAAFAPDFRTFAGIFAVLAGFWAFFRILRTSFVDYRANGITLVEDGTPTLAYFAAEIIPIVIIVVVAWQVEKKRNG